MAVTVSEAAESRSQRDGLNPSAELVFIASGTSDENTAINAVKDQLTTYRGLWPNEVSLEPLGFGSDGLPNRFRSVVTYGPVPGGIGVGDDDDIPPTFSAEFSTESVTIQQGLAVVNTYPAPTYTAGNFLGAINVTSDGVQGVEIEVPVFSFSLSWTIPTENFTTSYQATVARLVGCINNSTWRGFQAKEVRFDGLSVSGTIGERTSLTWRFSVSPNVSGLEIGSITGITKAGWDYLWCYYVDNEDPDAKFLIKKPIQVTVNQVYPLANFLALGLGG